MKNIKPKSKQINKPIRAPLVPVTVEMLNECEARLTHKMEAGFQALRSEFSSELRSEIGGVKSDVAGIKSKLNIVKSDIAEIKSDLSGVKSELSGVKSELHRVALLVEEQNARNKYVLDGYAQLYELIESRLPLRS